MENIKMNKLDMKSKDIVTENVSNIEKLFPNVVIEGKIDFNALKQELSNDLIDDKKEKYQLTWVGKRNAIADANKEINKTLRPIKDKSVHFSDTKNIYIEGDNFEVLKILQESYINKVNLIYIDPPYNTGNDFIYKDNFHKDETNELLLSGQIDEYNNKLVSNSNTNGRFHSDWLTMMYSRLKLARNLLSDDGVIFLSINDAEQCNLEKITNEIFGERNFVAKLVWSNNEGGGSSDSKFFKVKHEYILCYAKKIEQLVEIKNIVIEDEDRYKLQDEFVETRGKYQLVKLSSASLQYSQSLDYELESPDGTIIKPVDNTDKNRAIWRWSKNKYQWGVENKFIEWKKDKNNIWQVYTKQYTNCDKDGKIVERTKKPLGFINEYSSTQGSKEIFELFDGVKTFCYPKPTNLIVYLLERFAYKKDSLILDFFSGSATTAHAVMKMNSADNGRRKYIMVQLPEKVEEKTEAFKNGYKTICEIGEERIRRAIKKIKEETNADIDYGFRVYKVDSSNMKDIYYEPSKLKQEQLNMFESNIKEDRTPEDLLTQVILDLGLTLDLSIEEKDILNNKVYFVAENSLVACFDKQINIDIINKICEVKPLKVVFRESSFRNDSEKINSYERIKKLSPETEISVI